LTGTNERTSADKLYGPLVTWSGDVPIAVVFSKRQALEVIAKMGSVLFVCVDIPKPALFRSDEA
jgi:hypothetical protein